MSGARASGRPTSIRRQQRGYSHFRNQGGYLLLAVAVTLTVIAAAAFLINRESALLVQVSSGGVDATQVDYVAQAGLHHALWQTNASACAGDITIPSTAFGPHSYDATITAGGTTTGYKLPVDQDTWIKSDDPTADKGSLVDQHVRFESGVVEQALFRFDLSPVPAGAQINSATAWFYVESGQPHPEGPITIHRVTSDWTETGANWETLDGQFDSQVLATIPAQAQSDVWVRVNLTAQVQAWVNGKPNYGILFSSSAEGIHGRYISREGAAGQQPRLDVIVGTGPATPATITATGTLTGNPSPANDITRTLTRIDVPAYQPGSYTRLQPGAASGKDAEIWDQAPNNNYGNAAETWVSSASNDTTRTLLRFNMGEIPVGARILGATLSLNRQSGSGADQPVSAHRIRNPWSEDSVTWNVRETGTNWDTAGGDFDNMAVATTPVGPANQRYEWKITPLVQGWVDGSYPNYGVALTAAIAGMPGERFNTSDHADPSLWPSLSITYTCECGSVCMAPQGTGNVLMVIGNSPSNPSPAEIAIRDRLESWGYTVSLIQDDDSQGNYNAQAATHDVVYVSETAASANVSTKLTNLAIGVVNEQGNLNDELGMASAKATPVGSTIDIVDTSHYITLPFPAGTLEIYSAAMEGLTVSGTEAPGLQTLADRATVGTLVVLDQGAQMTSGGTAAGRRVMLPLGRSTNSNFTWEYLNNNGRLIVQRAIAWAMNADVVSIGNVLMVVVNDASLTSQESAKKALIQFWGYTVNLIDQNDNQSAFDAAVAANDVAFITEDVSSTAIGTKLVDATIGVVTEEANLSDEFGLSDSIHWGTGTSLNIDDNAHYITNPFSLGSLTVLTTAESLADVTGTLAPDLQTLGSTTDGPALVAVDAGGTIVGGGAAAGRRVQLPWGGNDMDVNHLTADGVTIFQRSLEWGTGLSLTGPIAHWMLDETSGTTAVDSVGGHDGTLVSNPAWVAGTLDGGLDLDGVNDYVDVGTFDVSGSGLTLMGWFNAETIPTSDGRIVSKASSPNATDAWWQLSTTDSGSNRYLRMRVKAGGTTTTLADSSVNLMTGQWYFAVATYHNVSGEMKLYLDGVEVASGTHAVGGPVDADPTVPVAIGANGTAERFFDGTLDDVRVYDRALSAAEIAELAAPPRPEPVAHWKLDETSGTTAADSVGGNDGTLNNGPVWTPGTIDGGLDFDGSNDYVITDSNFTPPPVGTVTFWMKVSGSPGSHGRILGLHDTWEIRHVTTGTPDGIPYGLVFDLGVSGVNTGFVTTVTIDTPGQWYHVAASYDTNTDAYAVYIDGVAHKSGTYPSALSVPTANPLSLGTRTGSSDYYDGMLDDVRVYDTVLTPAEIADLVAAGGGGGGPVPGAVVYESFEEFIDADNNSASISVTKPAGTAPGELLIAVVVVNRNNESSLVADDPSWTLLTRDRQANAMTVGVWWKLAGGSEPPSYGFSWGSGARSYSWIMRFSGNDPTNPINVWAKYGECCAIGPLSPAVTTTVDDTLILRIGGFDDDDITIGDPGMAGHTPITMQKSNTGTGTVSGGAAYVDQATSGDSGTANFTLTASEQSRTITLGIAPTP